MRTCSDQALAWDSVEDVLDEAGTPVTRWDGRTTKPHPVTDEEVRIRTVLPHGWVFYEAEVGSGAAKGTGDIKFDYSQRHSSLAHFAFNNDGMAYDYAEAKQRYGLDKVLCIDELS